MSNIDYALGAGFIDSFMIDECIIVHDEQNTDDDILDEDTGELVPPVGDSGSVYEGPCLLKPIQQKDLEFIQGAAPLFRKVYRVLLPISVVDVKIGDTFTLTIGTWDPFLVGKTMRINQITGQTHRVYRNMLVERIDEDDNVILTSG
jgi:hypothetical protein